MDPYLEPHWLDVHTHLNAYASDALNQVLPEDLVASTEERVAVESDEGVSRLLGPDVRVFEPQAGSVIEEESGVATAPLRLLAQDEPITERYIRIIDAGAERLITVIEFLSPTNKHGEGLIVFRAKRAELLASGVNFVEIDVVRAGDWLALLRPHRCPKRAMTPYRATVRIPSDPAAVYYHPISLRSPLPAIPIPLRVGDPEVKLDLQDLINQIYSNGRYARRLDYAAPPPVPLEAPDVEWTDHLLRSAGRR